MSDGCWLKGLIPDSVTRRDASYSSYWWTAPPESAINNSIELEYRNRSLWRAASSISKSSREVCKCVAMHTSSLSMEYVTRNMKHMNVRSESVNGLCPDRDTKLADSQTMFLKFCDGSSTELMIVCIVVFNGTPLYGTPVYTWLVSWVLYTVLLIYVYMYVPITSRYVISGATNVLFTRCYCPSDHPADSNIVSWSGPVLGLNEHVKVGPNTGRRSGHEVFTRW